MITYVVDNNIFSMSFNNNMIEVFKNIWEPWGELIKNKRLISVDEVFYELEAHWKNDTSLEWQWVKDHRFCFQKPTNKECEIMADIFTHKKFQEGIKEKSLRNGTPEADAFLVAKACCIGGMVVTCESDDKPNSEKIPNIASCYKVPYMKRKDFYQMLINIYEGKPEYENVSIYLSLGVASSYKEYYMNNIQ